MWSIIQEEVKTVEGVENMLTENLYYAWKWYEEGSLKVSEEVARELSYQMCLRGV